MRTSAGTRGKAGLAGKMKASEAAGPVAVNPTEKKTSNWTYTEMRMPGVVGHLVSKECCQKRGVQKKEKNKERKGLTIRPARHKGYALLNNAVVQLQNLSQLLVHLSVSS